eukprot:scaffold1838_cov381-Prasinococcus_capsulatus_cf.AAC.5
MNRIRNGSKASEQHTKRSGNITDCLADERLVEGGVELGLNGGRSCDGCWNGGGGGGCEARLLVAAWRMDAEWSFEPGFPGDCPTPPEPLLFRRPKLLPRPVRCRCGWERPLLSRDADCVWLSTLSLTALSTPFAPRRVFDGVAASAWLGRSLVGVDALRPGRPEGWVRASRLLDDSVRSGLSMEEAVFLPEGPATRFTPKRSGTWIRARLCQSSKRASTLFQVILLSTLCQLVAAALVDGDG